MNESSLRTERFDDRTTADQARCAPAGAGFREIDAKVSGPKNRGLVIAEVEQGDGAWRPTRLALTLEGQSTSIDLLAPADAGDATP